MLDFRQELVGQNGDVRLLQSGSVKDVYDLVGRNGAGNDLPDGQLQLFRRFSAAFANALCQHRPDFLALNPNGKVPTLTVDGAPMFEALAIQLWLGETYGVERGLWPAPGTPERLQALSWCAWAYVSYGAVLTRLHRA